MNWFDHERDRKIIERLDEIIHLLAFLVFAKPLGFAIHQLGAPHMITGVPAGGKGTFQETPIPAGAQIPAGSTLSWTADDTLVTLAPSADGTQVVASVDASDKAADFGLTFSALFPGAAAPVTATVRVPIIQAPPPPPPVPTGFTIDQTA